jgi:hypothetical protein
MVEQLGTKFDSEHVTKIVAQTGEFSGHSAPLQGVHSRCTGGVRMSPPEFLL